MKLVCGGINFELAAVECRERVAFSPTRLAEALPRLKSSLNLAEVVLVSTCNRVEYFGVTEQPEQVASAWPKFLQDFHEVNDDFRPVSFHYHDAACATHLFQVAAGLKSMVVGETEIFGQVKDAYEVAQRAGVAGKWMHRLFQSSFAAAKEVRTHTGITRGSVSVGSVAVELAEKIFGELRGRSVMMIGAGDTCEKTARALSSRGVDSILVANRTYEHAVTLAQTLAGRAVAWEGWETEVSGVDIIISSTHAPHYVLTREKLALPLARRSARPLFLIDLAVPRDICPTVTSLDDVFLFDIDDLQSIAGQNLAQREAEIAQGQVILEQHVTKLMRWAAQQATGSPWPTLKPQPQPSS
jgi:glutamyl-tRNA reductase